MTELYPDWKKALWEAWRVFGLAAGAVIVAQLEAGVDINNWQAWLRAVAVAAAAAGVKALFKYLREKFGRRDYDSLLYKLPA